MLLCGLVLLFAAVFVQAAEDQTDQEKQPAAETQAADKMPAVKKWPADPDKGREPSLEWGNELYGHYCIPCHGIKGDGTGFNAYKLIVKPANHTDGKFMSERNDQKLSDTINLGGVEVAKSTLMPPWGAALSHDDDVIDNKIKSLVMKLRDLCQCKATKNW